MIRTVTNRGILARRAATLALSAVSVFALSACDNITTLQRLGVSIDEAGSLEIHYVACDYERVEAVALLNAHDESEPEDDEKLWEIRSDAGSDGGVFPVGSTPPGFVETVNIGGPMPAEELLVATVELDGSFGAAFSFRIDDLEAGQVRTIEKPDGANLDLATFEQGARGSCRGAQSSGR